MSACKFCGRADARFVKAHVIPRSFFKIVRGDGKFAVEMQAKHSTLETPYHQAGVNDPAMLCEDCEPKFGSWDTYGFELLSAPKAPSDFRNPAGEPMAFELKKVNYELLTLFLLSVLWRAAVTTVSFFDLVKLGPYEERIRELLWTNTVPDPGDYAVQLGTTINDPYPNVILRPQETRHAGIRFYRLYFPNVFVLVKMDQRPAPVLLQKAMLQRRDVNYVIAYPYTRSPYIHFFEGLQKRIGDLRRQGAIRD